MAQPFVGSIVMFGGTYAPAGWLACSGQQVTISEYEVLFTLIGTTYGGDGITTFALPNLQSRIPVGMGQGTAPGNTAHPIGQTGGVESVTITQQQLPAHTHTMTACNAAGNQTALGSGGTLADQVLPSVGQSGNAFVYATAGTLPQVAMSSSSVGNAGISGAHSNIQPVLGVQFCIAYLGIFPSQA
ncbi:MAG TPA: tail fiber protein [Rhizomicrobium sp.]|jgi:microcystin-dependent protein